MGVSVARWGKGGVFGSGVGDRLLGRRQQWQTVRLQSSSRCWAKECPIEIASESVIYKTHQMWGCGRSCEIRDSLFSEVMRGFGDGEGS